jgi:hypothetical protein
MFKSSQGGKILITHYAYVTFSLSKVFYAKLYLESLLTKFIMANENNHNIISLVTKKYIAKNSAPVSYEIFCELRKKWSLNMKKKALSC